MILLGISRGLRASSLVLGGGPLMFGSWHKLRACFCLPSSRPSDSLPVVLSVWF